MIDKNANWSGEDLYLWNGKDTLFRISEGTGDNLFAEDVEAGYADYWMTEWFTITADCELEADGGQWMETELILDKYHTVGAVLDRVMECDLWEDDWRLLEMETGEELYRRFDEWCTSLAKANTDGWRVSEFVKRLS